MSELKLCPFCGVEPLATREMIVCNNMDCMVDSHTTRKYGTLEEQSDWWNTRPIEDALQAKLDIAVEVLKIIAGKTYTYEENIPSIYMAREALKKLEA